MNSLGRYTQIILVAAIVLVINILAGFIYKEFDLTEDRRYTVTENTKRLVADVDDNITIRVLLDGEFPAGFKRLQASTKDLLDKFRDINPRIVYEFEDPTEGPARMMEQRRKQLVEDKIIPVNLTYFDGKQSVQKAVFPFAIINLGPKKQIINLLEEQKPGDDENEVLNKSVALLEYKFANAFQKIKSPRRKNVIITQGNDEWQEDQLFRLREEINKFHRVGFVSLDTLMMLDTTIDLVIVPGPKTEMTTQNKFKIDQFVMEGGNVIWLIDKFKVSLDSINKYKFYVPEPIETGLDDLLFKYGARILPDLIMDLECSQIPQVIGMAGDKPQTRLFPWYYHPAIAAISLHPIVKNIDRVNMAFPSTIDTIKTDAPIVKNILLQSSPYSKTQLAGSRLSFEILKTSPDPSKFNNGNKPVALLLEGSFESYFKNRVTPEMQNTLDQLGIKIKLNGQPAKQLIVSDSDFTRNLINRETGQTEDIGFNKWERRFYKGNKDFILNAVEYMLDENNILESRSKEIKLRLLDKVKIQEEQTKWQLINIVFPLLMIGIFGILYHFIRKRRYSKNYQHTVKIKN